MADRKEPREALTDVYRQQIVERVEARFRDDLDAARGPMKWVLRRRLRQAIEDEIARVGERLQKPPARHNVHLF